MHSRYFPEHCTLSGFNLVAICVSANRARECQQTTGRLCESVSQTVGLLCVTVSSRSECSVRAEWNQTYTRLTHIAPPRLNSSTCRVNDITHLTTTVDPLVLLLAPTLPLMLLPLPIAPAAAQGSQQFHEPPPTPDLVAA